MLKQNANKAHLILSLNLMALSLTLYGPVMFWIHLLVIASVVMRIALFLDIHKHLPKVRTINLLALLAAIVLAYTGWHVGLLLSMVNLLVMSGALKLMMMRKVRDYFLLVAVELFIVGCGFIFQQSISFSILYALLIFTVLLSLCYHVAPSISLSRQLKLVGKICLQAVPICVLLFLILPQLSPLWQMPRSGGAETGISDQITPGDFASLSQSSSLAFRASFDGEFPPQEERYWRALVYEYFDGRTWSVSPTRARSKARMFASQRQFNPSFIGEPYQYDVIIEPTSQHWLFALDVARPVSENVLLSFDYQIQSTIPIMTKYKYRVHSYPDTPLNQAPAYIDTQTNLQLPGDGNNRTRTWVVEMRTAYPDNERFISAVEHYIQNENNFVYTLTPTPMPVDPIDRFLFDEQAGFCAHYASAYAYIMRLAGIPARIVGGYQGGENREDNYMSIYQYDAHAWVEIWHPEKGWIRKDPTGLVSPDRINFGLESAVAHENSFLADSPLSLARLKSMAFFNQLRLLMADVDFMWSAWVLGFDQERQLSLFKSLLGEISRGKLALLSLGVLLIIGTLLLAFNFRVWFPKITNRHLYLYNQATAILQKHGFPRNASEGPTDYANRIKEAVSEQCSEDFRHITKLFIFHEYAPASPTNPDRLTELMLAVKSFKSRYRGNVNNLRKQ